jgi:hypothetical protein
MLSTLSLLERTGRLALVFPLAALCAAGCGDDGTANAADGGNRNDGPLEDGAVNNPPNPDGLGPAPVDLGETTDLKSAGAYVLLAKTGITNVTGTTITGGHLGVSPEVAESITGFALVADDSTEFATSSSVIAPAKVYASNYSEPTPTNLTAAVLSMEGAFTDAAGRTTPDYLNLGDGEIGGETLAPGLYVWGSTVTIPGDVTIAGGANDVWIFQISDNLDLSADKKVLLSGGAKAKNIFWQVSGEVIIHERAHFEGIIVCQTGITLQANASMRGRALAQSLIALNDNDITAP